MSLASYQAAPPRGAIIVNIQGLPSGDFLTRLPDTPFTLDPEKSALTLDLVFPLVEQADATIVVPGVGSYDLNQH